ncbi:hypothetical protein [Planctomycetes bacterium Pan216]|uniref:tetratricopeptide repeat protein n=1 Tax=Kolteria novifilia TaxID=2527975 RepID=UPI00119D53BF
MFTSLEEMLRQAAIHFHADDPTAGLSLINEAIESFSWDPRPWEVRGGMHQQLGEIGLAINDLEFASSLGPLSPSAQLALADCYRRRGENHLCARIARQLACDPNCTTRFLSQISCLLGLVGDFSTALAVCERIIEERPCAHPAWFGIGYYRARLEFSPKQILPFVARAHELNSAHAVYKTNLALLRIASGDEREGWAILEEMDSVELRCPSLLQAVQAECARVGNATEAMRWRAQANELANGAHGTGAPQCRRRNCCLALPTAFTSVEAGEGAS